MTLPEELSLELLVDLVQRSHALEDLAHELSAQDFISTEAPKLLDAMADIAVALRKEAIALDCTTPVYGELLQGIDRSIRRLAEDIRLPARATSDRVPGVLARLVKGKARAIYPDADVILRPVWAYQYKIHREDVHERFQEDLRPHFTDAAVLDRALAKIPQRLFIISFPAIEKRSIHLHSVIGHELGHLIAKDYEDSKAKFQVFKKRVAALLRKPKSKNRRSTAKQASLRFERGEDPVLRKAIGARNRALKEFAADLASVYIFGIAAVLGAGDVAVASGLGDAADYPPWGMRLRHMLDLADSLGWTPPNVEGAGRLQEATEAVARRVEALRRLVGKSALRARDQFVDMGHASAEENIPAIRKFLSERLRNTLASATTTYARLPALFERLEEEVPPDNLGGRSEELPNLEDILTAAWWVKCRRAPSFADSDLSEATTRRLEVVRRLTLKAVESIDVVAEFRGKLEGVYR